MVADTTTRARGGATARTAALVLVLVGTLRLVGVALLWTSVAYGWRAWYARFGVCVGDEPPVELPPDQQQWWCTLMEDHLYDQVMPSDPWVPIPDVARLEGLSLMVLGVGVAVVAASLAAGRWFVWVASVVAGVGLGAAWVGMGLPVWRTALAGAEHVGFDDFMTASSLTLLTMLATAGMAVLSGFHGGRDRRLLVLFWVLVTLAQPGPEYFGSMFLWGSHDTSPALGLLRCVLVALAGLVAVATLVPRAWRPPVPGPLRRAAGSVRQWWADGTTDHWR